MGTQVAHGLAWSVIQLGRSCWRRCKTVDTSRTVMTCGGAADERESKSTMVVALPGASLML